MPVVELAVVVVLPPLPLVVLEEVVLVLPPTPLLVVVVDVVVVELAEASDVEVPAPLPPSPVGADPLAMQPYTRNKQPEQANEGVNRMMVVHSLVGSKQPAKLRAWGSTAPSGKACNDRAQSQEEPALAHRTLGQRGRFFSCTGP